MDANKIERGRGLLSLEKERERKRGRERRGNAGFVDGKVGGREKK